MDYSKCTLVELRQMAKELGVEKVSTFKKEELIELLQNTESKGENQKKIHLVINLLMRTIR